MVKNHIREWFLDHPKVLWFAFLVASQASERIPEITTNSGGSSYRGP
jgi:hypothetical protein